MDPNRPDRYVRWMSAGRLEEGLSRPWLKRTLALGLTGAAVFAGVIAARWYGLLPGGILLAAGIAMLLGYLVLWRELMLRAHRHLSTRGDLGDVTRVLMFFAVFLGLPAITVVIPVLILALAID